MTTTRTPPPPAVEPITLRPATVADAPALALIGAATFLEAFTWMLPGGDIVSHCAKHHTAAAYEAYLAKPNTRITLATAGPFSEDQSPVGFTLLCDPELPTIDLRPTDIELKRIYLFSRFRTAPVLVSRCNAAPTEPSTDVSSRPKSERSGDAVERPAVRPGDTLPTLRPAQALLDLAIADSLTLHRTRLLLGVNDGNQRALDFYYRNGFADIGTRTFQVGSLTCSDLILAKELSPG